MTILPSLDIFEKYSSNKRDKVFSDVNTIFYNENNKFLITKNYSKFLESRVTDSELIKLLIVELYDKDRICADAEDNNEEDVFENLYIDNSTKIDCLFAITIKDAPKIKHFRYVKQNTQTKNKDFIIFELIKNNIISLHHYNFENNDEVQDFIKRLFDLPTQLSKIYIYNRYSEHNYFGFLKNKSIQYFNLIRKGSAYNKRLEYFRIETDLKNNLGRNVVLRSTDNPKLIHERKIFFNHFILTFDQAFDYLLVTEPNWKFDIQVDSKKCITEWAKKNDSFQRFT